MSIKTYNSLNAKLLDFSQSYRNAQTILSGFRMIKNNIKTTLKL